VVISCVNLLDDMTLTVSPARKVRPGTRIAVNYTVRYGGSVRMSNQQSPRLTLTLDNEPAFPTGRRYDRSGSRIRRTSLV